MEPLTSPTSQDTLPTPQISNFPPFVHSGSFSTPLESSRFPLEKLVSSSPPSSEKIINQYQRNGPATPSVSDDEVEEMDWTPSGPATQLFASSNQPNPMDNNRPLKPPVDYTAFNRKIPAVPRPPAWRLQSPLGDTKAKPVQSQRPNPFKHTPKTQFASSTGAALSPETPVMAPPRFFPPEDFAETGLETLFGRAFRVSDDAETDTPKEHQSTEKNGHSSHSLPLFSLQLVLVTGLLVLLVAVLCGVLLLPSASWGPSIWKSLERFKFLRSIQSN